MMCPSPIAEVLLDILHHGLLACRAAGWAGHAERCAMDADHLHNLPDLIADYSADRLQYYWDVERPSFAARCDPGELRFWEEQWERLRPFVEQAGELAAAR